tara:strand:+ start:20376 stop:21278 length:903 start_codon:yes stop_codon:yes gene_type:complete
MRILVLGGAGFIGAHIVEELLSEGHFVRVLDRSPASKCLSVEYIQIDFNDVMALSEALVDIDTVIHLVSTSVPSTSNNDPVSDINGNLVNTIRLLEAMKNSGVKKIIYFSSGGTVYGHPQISPMDEFHVTNPVCSYGIVKLAIEKYLNMYSDLYGFISIIMRPSNPYGLGQRRMGVQGFIGTCINLAINEKILTIWGDGSVVRDYIHVSDVVRATIKMLDLEQSNIFNISSGNGYTLNEIVGLVEKFTRKKINITYKDKRDFDISVMVLNNNRAMKLLNWTPLINIEKGIEMTVSGMNNI